MLTFNLRYFILTLFFLIIEILIALYVKDAFIRPYLGDTIVVILIYCFLRSFISISTNKAVAFTLGFALLIETLQFFNFVNVLGWEESQLARTVLGNSFSWLDVIAYCAGAVLIIIAEKAGPLKRK